MTLEEYKEKILLHLEKARDCEEVERTITLSIERMREKGLPAAVIQDYLTKLRNGLEALSEGDFDPVHWCNIRCAILYLKNYH
ncbi:hypothetical protein Q4E93_07195 [Flavitalea sp. BT771]|uniref:hypothetical protein n=1 Tax=Flavitalea sp. BT771 TaxID=3063329 RepID=UPI0026E2617E|nr:hypothetical protein [Flavitalea sp. BT771]MDO6430364.1 hypothetical protein [Flavitalea sp. BT771]MDV6219496.1 hypothetical protein [Flavitalea sp. BT771]